MPRPRTSRTRKRSMRGRRRGRGSRYHRLSQRTEVLGHFRTTLKEWDDGGEGERTMQELEERHQAHEALVHLPQEEILLQDTMGQAHLDLTIMRLPA